MKIPFDDAVKACQTGRDNIRKEYEIDYDNLKLKHADPGHSLLRMLKAQLEQLERDYAKGMSHGRHSYELHRQYEASRRMVAEYEPINYRVDQEIPLLDSYLTRPETFDEWILRTRGSNHA